MVQTIASKLLSPRSLKLSKFRFPESACAPIGANQIDDFWSGVATQSFREIKEGGVPAEGTEFRIAVGSDKMLYLAILCRDSDMENLNIMSTLDGDAAIWSGDFIEVQIETPDHLYYQICVGPAGNIMDIDRSEGLNDEWKSGVEVAVNRGKDEWTVEMRIPPAGATASEIDPNTGISGDLPTVNDPWYINVGRVRLRDGNAETSAWSPTGGTFHKPVPGAQKAFGRIFIEK